MGKAGSNPAFDVTYRGSRLARAVASRAPVLPRGSAWVGVIETEIACSPACLFDCRSAAMRFGMAVVKMPVTSVERRPLCGSEVAWFKSRRQECRSSVTALRSGNSIARFLANHYTIRGEDRCYFV